MSNANLIQFSINLEQICRADLIHINVKRRFYLSNADLIQISVKGRFNTN